MKLLIGPPYSGKTDFILGRLTKALREGRRDVMLIMPSSLTANVVWERLYQEALAAQETGLVKEDFVSDFPRLYSEILYAAKADKKLIRDINRRRLLRRIIAELARENALPYFQKIAAKPGLVDSVAAFIDELWRSDTEAADLVRFAAGKGAKDRDLARIFSRYDAALKAANRLDAQGTALAALRALEMAAGTDSPSSRQILQSLRSRFSLVAADGFDCYTSVQVKLLTLLGEIGVETVATLTYEAGRAVHLWQAPTWRRFAEVKADVLTQPATVTTPLLRVASTFMKDGEGKVRSIEKGEVDVPIKIVSAPDRAAEVRAIAREIKRLAIEEEAAVEEITVVCRSLDIYRHHIERIFSEHGLPYVIDAASPLCENACVVAVMRLLRLAGDAFPRRSVIDCLRSSYFDWSAFDVDEELMDILEQISFEEFVIQGRKQWAEAILSPTKTRGQEVPTIDAEKQRQAGAHLAMKLDRIFDAVTFPSMASEGDYIRQIKQLMETLATVERAKRGSTSVNDEAALQGFQELLEAFGDGDNIFAGGESVRIEDSRRVSWSSFFEEFERAVFSTSFARPGSKLEQRGVVIQECHNQRPRAYQVVFVAGLIEGEFPKKISETSPYTLVEREELRRAGIDLAESTSDAGADLMQFHKAIARARERLYFSFARTDLAGGELLKSYLIDEVESICKPEKVTIRPIDFDYDLSSRIDFLSLEELAQVTARALGEQVVGKRRVSENAGVQEAETVLRSRLKSWAATVRGAAVERRRLGRQERGMFGGFILAEELVRKLEKRFGGDYLWSASRINDFGQCPFLFFARDVLQLAPLVEPAESFAADRLGDAYHKILEETFGQLKRRGIELSEDTLSEAIAVSEEMSEIVLAEMLARREVRENRLWEFDKRDIKKRIVNLLRAEIEANRMQSTTPLAFEKRFGRYGEPPLVVETAAGKVKFTGTIDRLDRSDEGLVVIDYKTRRTPIHQREAEEGRNLQLPIYLMAAKELGEADQPVAGGYYLHISSCKRGSEFPNKHTSVEEITAQAKQFIGDYVSRVRRAEFPVAPTRRDCDDYCRYNVMCRIQSLGLAGDDE